MGRVITETDGGARREGHYDVNWLIGPSIDQSTRRDAVRGARRLTSLVDADHLVAFPGGETAVRAEAEPVLRPLRAPNDPLDAAGQHHGRAQFRRHRRRSFEEPRLRCRRHVGRKQEKQGPYKHGRRDRSHRERRRLSHRMSESKMASFNFLRTWNWRINRTFLFTLFPWHRVSITSYLGEDPTNGHREEKREALFLLYVHTYNTVQADNRSLSILHR